MRRFALAVLTRDETELGRARDRVLEDLGPGALVDAAAVVGLFDSINRVADATGTVEPDEEYNATVELVERHFKSKGLQKLLSEQ